MTKAELYWRTGVMRGETNAFRVDQDLKHLFPDPAVFLRCNAAMDGVKLIIEKHVAYQVNKHSPDSRK